MEEGEELRGVWDIGSGATKLAVAKVDQNTNTIKEILFSEEREVLVGQALKQSRDGSLPTSILNLLGNTLDELQTIAKTIAKKYQTTMKYTAIATAAFREATNGLKFLDETSEKMNVKIRLISQAEEGKYGFLTGVSCYQLEEKNLRVNYEELIVWDSGGSSFQLTSVMKNHSNPQINIGNEEEIRDEELVVFEGAFGSSKVTSMMIENVQQADFRIKESANPASQCDCEQLLNIIKASLNDHLLRLENENRSASWIAEKLKNPNHHIIAIGGDTNVFRMASIALQSRIITREKVWNFLIDHVVGKSDEELKDYLQQGMLAPKLCLLCAVFDVFQFPSICYYYSVGSTLGLLATRSLW